MIKKILRLLRFKPTNQWVKSLKIKGKNFKINNNFIIEFPSRLQFGNNVKIKSKVTLNAKAGIALGDNCILKKGVSISTVTLKKGKVIYQPVVIGAGNTVEPSKKIGDIMPNKLPIKGLTTYSGQPLFIISTGRSGSTAIASLLNEHSDINCLHDAYPHLNTWSCEKLYGLASNDIIQEKLRTLYNCISIPETKVYGQSDQKLSPLIPLLSNLYPKAKFIWLIRDAAGFISSSYPRGWFFNSEFNYPINKNEFIEKRATPSDFHAAHRPNAFLIGEMSEVNWKEMSAFERNCWYWYWWNNMIEKHLEKLSKERYMMVRLSEMEVRTTEILDFIGVDRESIQSQKKNEAKYKKEISSNWNDEMKSIYKRWCEPGMKRWFND